MGVDVSTCNPKSWVVSVSVLLLSYRVSILFYFITWASPGGFVLVGAALLRSGLDYTLQEESRCV
jgi:hypothetical protein